MIPTVWKEFLKQEKNLLNQIVIFYKQNHSNFQTELVGEFLIPYYTALGKSIPEPKSFEEVQESFEMLIKLIQKGYLRDPKGQKEILFFKLIESMSKPLTENFLLSISYLINVSSKLKGVSEEKFLNQLLLLRQHIDTLEIFKLTLITLIWVDGHPEYRIEALNVYKKLPKPIQIEFSKSFYDSPEEFHQTLTKNPFGIKDIKQEIDIKYKIISSHPLLGGEFKIQPLLNEFENNFYAIVGTESYQIHFDLFGSTVHPVGLNLKSKLGKLSTPFWKNIIIKFFNENQITSVIETENFALITLNESYSVYLFYRAAKK
ncbi:MAG: hypothetical protein SH817_07330 [Leptospira sp.]|nr:hypothetical protein [Leptospira sp.]